MKSSDEIMSLMWNHELGSHGDGRGESYIMGFQSARGEASLIANRYDGTAGFMADALAMIDTSDPVIVEALGQQTVFNIRYALKAYREQQTK